MGDCRFRRDRRLFLNPDIEHRRADTMSHSSVSTTAAAVDVVRLPDPVRRRLIATATAVHAAGLKSFGLLVASPEHPDFPFTASDVVFFDPLRNRRNEPVHRAAFEAQGEYFRSFDDAGFVADAGEV